MRQETHIDAQGRPYVVTNRSPRPRDVIVIRSPRTLETIYHASMHGLVTTVDGVFTVGDPAPTEPGDVYKYIPSRDRDAMLVFDGLVPGRTFARTLMRLALYAATQEARDAGWGFSVVEVNETGARPVY